MGQTAPNTETDRYSLSLIYVFLVPRAHATGEHVSEAKTRAEARRRGDREERESVRGGDERDMRGRAACFFFFLFCQVRKVSLIFCSWDKSVARG